MVDVDNTVTDSSNGSATEVVDLNKAELDGLVTLPGVGPVMAERIRAARPFQDLEDLQRVNGIGPDFVERLKPLVTLDPEDGAPEQKMALNESTTPAVVDLVKEVPDGAEAQPESMPEGIVEAPGPVVAEAPVDEDAQVQFKEVIQEDFDEADLQLGEVEVEADGEGETKELIAPEADVAVESEIEAPPEKAAEAEPKMVTRGQAFWLAIGVGFLSFLMALLLNLGILASINGGLRFATPGQIAALDRQIAGLTSQAGILQQDLDGLRSRIDNLEPLGARVSEVETIAGQLQGEMANTADQINDLNQQTEILSEEVGTLQSQSERVTGFLDGMRNLLEQFFAPGEGK